MSAGTADSIRIFLRDIEIEMLVGIYPAEQAKPQTVIVHIEVESDATRRYDNLHENRLDQVLDYEKIYRYVREELPLLGHVPLLESVAEQIVSFCFRDPRARNVRVHLDKVDAFPGITVAGVILNRTRAS